MRLGIFELRSPIVLARRPRQEEIATNAYTGLRAYGGLIVHDYNPDCRGIKWFETVDKMRNYARIQAAEQLMILPVQFSNIHFEPSPYAGSLAKEATDMLQKNLFETCETAFVDVIRLALLARLYGVRVLCPEWTIEDGKVFVKSFLDLLPTTYYRWKFERNKPVALIQYAVDPDTGHTKTVEIPLDRVVRFTWREEGNNPEGRSDARGAYGHWYLATFCESVIRVALERAGVGAWKGSIPRDLWDNTEFRNEVKSILKMLRSHEEGAVVLPTDVTIDVITAVEKQGVQILSDIWDRALREMSHAVLAGIFNVGMTDIGTSSWAEQLLKLTAISLNGSIHWFCQNFTNQFVSKWMQWNYPDMPKEEYPVMRFSDVQLILNPEGLVRAWNEATQAGNLPKEEPEIQAYIAQVLGLPWRPKQLQTTSSSQHDIHRNEVIRLQREGDAPTDDENVELIKSAETALQREMKQLVDKIVDAVVSAIADIADEFDKTPLIKKGVVLRKLNEIEIPLASSYRAKVLDILNRTYEQAAKLVAKEMRVKELQKPNWVAGWIETLADALTEDAVHNIKFAAVTTALREITLRQPVDLVRRSVEAAAMSRLQTSLDNLENAAAELVQKMTDEHVFPPLTEEE